MTIVVCDCNVLQLLIGRWRILSYFYSIWVQKWQRMWSSPCRRLLKESLTPFTFKSYTQLEQHVGFLHWSGYWWSRMYQCMGGGGGGTCYIPPKLIICQWLLVYYHNCKFYAGILATVLQEGTVSNPTSEAVNAAIAIIENFSGIFLPGLTDIMHPTLRLGLHAGKTFRVIKLILI